MDYDLIIVGGACAGLAAATYAGRRNLKTVVLTMNIGGQIATTPSVENYPGIDFITGPGLAEAMQMQALKWGAEIKFEEVTSLVKNGERDFTVTTNTANYKGKAVILAYGKTPRKLDVLGEDQYAGKGVSYCVTCDAPLFRKRTVAVVGGGNSAIEGALILAEASEKVYLVHRRNEFRAEAVLMEKIKNTPNIELVTNSVVAEIHGNEEVVTHITVADVADATKTRDITLHGVFVEVGFIVQTEFIRHMVTVDRMNQVVTNNLQETSTPGLYAAGDLTDTPYKQAVISASEGTKAALAAYTYIHGTPMIGVDWSSH
jgi:thioredoxin-disulfide reductase